VYTEKTLVVTGVDDKRACTKCTCGTPENKCAGNAQRWSGSTCGGSASSITLAALTSCTVVDSNSGIKLLSANSSAPSCTPNGGGAPTGDVAPSKLETICCAP
jgi:hypothetical protein